MRKQSLFYFILRIILLFLQLLRFMRKLLLVDDDADLLYSMQRLLAFYDYSIKAVKDGKTMFREIDGFHPDIILMDVMLSDEDGRELCRALREVSNYNQVTVILFSGSPKHLKDLQECGADGAIEKPFTMADLINQINFAVMNRKELLRSKTTG